MFYNIDFRTGEELCIAYQNILAEISEDKDCLDRNRLEAARNLKYKWGIFCPPDCICNDTSVLTLIAGTMSFFQCSFEINL
jgi:hypothetical protein